MMPVETLKGRIAKKLQEMRYRHKEEIETRISDAKNIGRAEGEKIGGDKKPSK